MAITATDLHFRLSTTAGSAGNTVAQGSPNSSLGKYASTTDWVAGTNSLFDNISGDENSGSVIDYRCVLVYNANASIAYENAVIYISSEVAGGASVSLAVDSIATSAIGSASAQAAQIANETTAPTGTTAFSSPTTKAAGLSLGTIPAGFCKAVWIKRTAANTAAINSDGFTVAIAGDTAA